MHLKSLLSLTVLAGMSAVSAFAGNLKIGDAKIPFSFRFGGATLPAGTYEIEAPHGRAVPMLTFRNLDTGDAAAILAPIAVSPVAGADNSLTTINFVCAGAECAFYRVMPAGSSGGWSVSKPKLKTEVGAVIPDGDSRLATVLVSVKSAD